MKNEENDPKCPLCGKRGAPRNELADYGAYFNELIRQRNLTHKCVTANCPVCEYNAAGATLTTDESDPNWQSPIRKRDLGLYEKYLVVRLDGKSAKGAKHYGCGYFVLDLSCDKFAAPALRAYAAACRSEYPGLARDLDERAEAIERRVANGQ